MEQVREKINDLVTVVERISKDISTGQETRAEIHLSYKKPDKLRSEIKGSRARVVVINGELMWIYSPNMQIAEKYSLEDEEKRQRAIYEMSWGLTSPIKVLVRGMNRKVVAMEDGSLLVELVPDQKDAQLEKIVARVDPESWLITRMDIFQSGQPPIHLRVTEWKANAGLSDSVFEFRVPPGTDVFEPLEKSPGSVF